jgi:hypothetical protein
MSDKDIATLVKIVTDKNFEILEKDQDIDIWHLDLCQPDVEGFGSYEATTLEGLLAEYRNANGA